jgi:hypothetical protein
MSTYQWRPGYRHQISWLPDSQRWWCKDCGQQFETWPSDDEACPGPAQREDDR